ncbi:hypothetical protein C8J57DRAFT_1538608 [Mycena rebaudengoi]|nr:hypothetical protein C8J57DRAFT_1538608 [Mycena rebaudengoi]
MLLLKLNIFSSPRNFAFGRVFSFLFPPPAPRRRRSSATGCTRYFPACSTVAAAPRQPVRPPSSSSMIPTRLFTLDYYLHLLHASPDANNPEVYGEVSDPEEPNPQYNRAMP